MLENVKIINCSSNNNITSINHMKKLKKITLNSEITQEDIDKLESVEELHCSENNRNITSCQISVRNSILSNQII